MYYSATISSVLKQVGTYSSNYVHATSVPAFGSGCVEQNTMYGRGRYNFERCEKENGKNRSKINGACALGVRWMVREEFLF